MSTESLQKIKVCLVDDHSMLRDSLAKTVNSLEECEVVLTAGNGKELIESLAVHPPPDIIVLDIAMPEMDGCATAQWLCKHKPDIKVLVLTMYDSENLIHLLRDGVRGFVKKDAHPGELKTAILAVMREGIYCSRTITGRLFNMMKTQGSRNSVWKNIVHSETELLFLKYLCTELTYKEIAAKMNISPRTIDNYRDALFTKVNVKSRVGLAVYAVRNGIVSL